MSEIDIEKHLTSRCLPQQIKPFLSITRKPPDIMYQGSKIYTCAITHIFRDTIHLKCYYYKILLLLPVLLLVTAVEIGSAIYVQHII